MQWVEAGRDLHALGLVDGVAVGHYDPGLLQRRPAVRETVLNDEILAGLGIDKRCDGGTVLPRDRLHVLYAERFELVGYILVRTRSDLIDHAPREAHALLIAQILDKALRDKAAPEPRLGNGEYRSPELFTVVAAIIHADNGDGVRSVHVAVIEQSGDFGHDVCEIVRALRSRAS